MLVKFTDGEDLDLEREMDAVPKRGDTVQFPRKSKTGIWMVHEVVWVMDGPYTHVRVTVHQWWP